MALKFITGNKNKFQEVKEILAPIEIEQLSIELEEIQSLDAEKVILHKLREAYGNYKGEFIVEDTSVYLECFDYKLPGPLIRWFLDTQGSKGLARMVEKMGKSKAYAVTQIGYAKNFDDIHFFTGKSYGKIVRPKGNKDFGWGPIYVPNGSKKTFGEMDRQEKYKLSMRGIATRKLKAFLMKKSN